MFSKILIANRGEIACRVMATARKMNIATVAVYSDADAAAKHVAMADEAVRIGPPPVSESYLRGDAIIEAALRTGAQAIHPGYGFLSENPEFVEAVEAAGLTFIGPPASAIRAMGLKDAAKALMHEAGVPVVPGYHGERQDIGFLEGEADAIGYPVLIKARAGGGGKGMRKVDRAADFRAALEGAQREAQASFGDPVCLIEKYITQPRHVEIQVFADAHGNVVHLYERDCSLQRRHQKVIEEAPAPGMTEDVRAAMGRAAVEAARAIGYVGAGTVEFIADGSRGLRSDGFWFMEMNTRLQVEHPVTESIFGWLDLVEWQLRVAAGEVLSFDQDALEPIGHAFEARIYAEDVPKGFLPATGRLTHLTYPPDAGEFSNCDVVRIDSGVRAGDEISPYYDPMIAKVIARGRTRAIALNALSRALAQTEIAGCVTNLTFLRALTTHQGFQSGEVDTGLIGRDLDTLSVVPEPAPETIAVAALAALGLTGQQRSAADDPWADASGFRSWGPAHAFVTLHHAGTDLDCVVAIGRDGFRVTCGGQGPVDLTIERLAGDGRRAGGLRLRCNGRTSTVRVAISGDAITVFDAHGAHGFRVVDPLTRAEETGAAGDTVPAPMPGLVKVVAVKPGDAVEAGAPLVVLEAMKMEHTLTAPRSGTIAEVGVTVGDQVSDGAVLIALEPEGA